MQDLKSASEELIDLIFMGADHGIDSMKVSKTLIPFIITGTEGKREIERFVTERIEDGKKKAEAQLKNQKVKPDRVIIVYDGYITVENKKYDAIIVKGFVKSQKQGYILAQRYKPKSFLKPLKTIGNLAFLENEPNILNE